MAYPRIREAPESSSAAVLNAVAAALADLWYQPQRSTPSQARMARWGSRLPASLVKRLVSRALKDQGLDPALARYVSSEGLARQALGVYEKSEPGVGYPAIFVGAPNGGVAYLAALLRVPFLPSHFLLSVADSTPVDDIRAYQRSGAAFIEPILDRNPDLHAVNHYDPVHDRFMVEHVNHVRLKLMDMPEAYRRFIREHLAPGGTIFFVDCEYYWHQYEIDPRHHVQVGGLGGYADEVYLNGSDELDTWLEKQGSKHRGGWTMPGEYPLHKGRESEWGTLPSFRDAAKRFCNQEQFQFTSIHGTHPEDFSALAYTAYLWESRLHKRTPQGILIDCFSQISPTAAIRSGLLPLWLPFNCDDSLEYLARMVPLMPTAKPILLSLLANFTQTPDLPGAQTWYQIVAKVGSVSWIGTNPERNPIDLASRFDYLPQLQQWVLAHPTDEPRPKLAPSDLQEMMVYLAKQGSTLFSYLLDVPEEDAHEEEYEEPDGETDSEEVQMDEAIVSTEGSQDTM